MKADDGFQPLWLTLPYLFQAILRGSIGVRYADGTVALERYRAKENRSF